MSGYSAERNVQLLISIMKANGIKRIVVSPGATNITFVASIQNDPFFQLYSSVDERSAAYLACGLAYESGEPVALSCTGATASRNYMPGLTEAFYRKLPVLAITSTQNEGLIGQGVPQVIDRSCQPKDLVKLSVSIPTIQGEEDERYANLKLNRAVLELTRNGGGPVHINLATNYSRDYSVRKLPGTRIIKRYTLADDFPEIQSQKTAIFVGAHKKWTERETELVERFCERYNAVVLCDHNSAYHGNYRIQANIVTDQDAYRSKALNVDLLIDIGNVSGAYMRLHPKETWRVCEDGEICDTFGTLKNVFQMKEAEFFSKYITQRDVPIETSFYEEWKDEHSKLYDLIPDLPFSNVWIARTVSKELPANSVIYLSILNTLRSWNFYTLPQGVESFSNTGGFGIDGGLSSLIGASLYNPEKIYFAFVGDLQFFYDMNALGNRHIGNNVRVLLINNGIGQEFKNYNHNAFIHGDKANDYIAASGHFGNKSKTLVKHFAEDLGFQYFSASNEEEFSESLSTFVSDKIHDKPMVFEVFTDCESESEAIHIMRNLETDTVPSKERITGSIKKSIRETIGDKRTQALKDLIKG